MMALKFFGNDFDFINNSRRDLGHAIRELELASREEGDQILSRIAPSILPIVEKRRIAFMREISAVTGARDVTAVRDYVFGLPLVGWTQPAASQVEKLMIPERNPEDLWIDVDLHNARIISACMSSGDLELDSAAWQKTVDELNLNMVEGPFRSLGECGFGVARTVRRFGIWECHGGAAEWTCRVIDDLLDGGQNSTAGAFWTHRPCDLDQWCALLRLVADKFLNLPLSQFTSDFAKAYKQVPLAPWCQCYVVLVQWSPEWQAPAFFISRTQLFGGRTAPINFARYATWCGDILAVLAAIALAQCVDDLLSAEPEATIASAFIMWRGFAEVCGWDVPDSKSPPPENIRRLLGAVSDLSWTPFSPPCLWIAEERSEKIILTLRSMLEKGLPAALAGQVWGQLGFAQTSMMGRYGRAMLKAFKRRQYEPHRRNLNPQIRAAIDWWTDTLLSPPPRPVNVDVLSRPMVVSYSDGEGADAGVGVAVWSPMLDRAVGGYIRVPHELRELWAKEREMCRDIYEIEAVGPLLILHNWPELLQDALWLHFIDNDAALSSLVKGSSSVMSGEAIVGMTWRKILECNVLAWFDRVDSKSNPVDGLSRGKLKGPWSLQDIELPFDLWQSVERMCRD